jgi:bifunctional DNase/RNase
MSLAAPRSRATGVPPLPALAVLLLACGLTACSGCSATPAPDAAPAAAVPEPPAPGTPLPLDDEYRPVEVATVGWDRLSASPVVLLRELETGQLVPIWVGVAEAQAIASALHEVDFPRPMTHDLMNDLLGKLHARLDELLIHDVVGGTYYGLLRLHVEGNGEEPLLVDARPSDGMALALRAGAAIRVSQGILDDTPDVDFLAPDEPEQVVRALGLTVVVPTPALRGEHAIPEERQGLVVIRAVGHAAEAGLRRGDLLLAVAGEPVTDPVGFLDTVRSQPIGEPVTLRYWREGIEREVRVVPELELPETEDGRGQQVA